MTTTPEQITVTKALFTVAATGAEFEVHFNPQSLQYTITNTMKNTGRNDRNKQHVSQSTGKLTMDLIFDTTDTGTDVRLETIEVAKFMEPNPNTKSPPEVKFEWGAYTFTGMAESYKETIDFFSANGVPLRASANITLSAKDKVFEAADSGISADTGGSMGAPQPPSAPNNNVQKNAPPGRGVTGLASQGGNASASRAIAEANGVANLRFPGEASISLSGNISLKPPTAFATGGVSGGLSIGGGAGIGLGIGGGISGGAGIGIGGGISAGAGISGGLSGGISAGISGSAGFRVGSSMSAGVSASEGAFAGLRVTQKPVNAKLNVGNFFKAESTAKFGVENNSVFDLSGQATASGSASISADVGKAGELSGKIEFKGG